MTDDNDVKMKVDGRRMNEACGVPLALPTCHKPYAGDTDDT